MEHENPNKPYKKMKWQHAKFVSLNWLTSIFGPCIVVDPRSGLAFFSCMLSSVGFATMLGSLIWLSYSGSTYFYWNLNGLSELQMIALVEKFRLICWGLLATVVLTSLTSYYSSEQKRQLLGLKLGLGSFCCNKTEQIFWACEREYSDVLKYYLDSPKMVDVVNAINVDGQNAFQFSHDNSKTKAMKILLQHPKNFFDATKVRSIFWKACYRGNIEILKLFLNHPQKQRLFTEKDYDGAGKKTYTRF